MARRFKRTGKINSYSLIKSVLYNGQVGTIKFTYDSPSKFLPYPSGYNHDLSLIASKTLPMVKSPPNVGEVVDWAAYEDALDGQPVFCCLFHVGDKAAEILEGGIASRETQEALVIGSEYIWEKNAVTQTASILWRTNQDHTTASGWSGSTLCVEKSSDKQVKALLFQNFQKYIRSSEVAGNDRELSNEYGCLIKGGFVLPQEIRDSEIHRGESAERTQTRNWASNPMRSRQASDNKRRDFSSPT